MTGFNMTEGGWRGVLLNMTSGTWMTPDDSTRFVWWHQLLVIIPTNASAAHMDVGMLWITGNGNDNPSNPAADDEDVLVCAVFAVETGTPCAVLWQVPNAPVVFASDPSKSSRSEDAAVSWTWREYMLGNASKSWETPDSIIYYPMARAGARAMDAVEEFFKAESGGSRVVNKWLVAGASKRGATTWLVGASCPDKVIGIMPIVFDLLNFAPTILHMWEALGGWTFAFTDYLAAGVPAFFGTPLLDRLSLAIDPIYDIVNYTKMSKLVVDGTGDEFFQVQDDSDWWGKLPGETLRLMLPNAEHSMATGLPDLLPAATTWAIGVMDGKTAPQFTWTVSPTDGSITVTVQPPWVPTKVLAYNVSTLDDMPRRRDFRLISGDTPANPCKYVKVDVFGKACLRPILWWPYNATNLGSNTWRMEMPTPAPGFWTGLLGELHFAGPTPGTEYILTTQVSVFPNTFPFPPCSGQSCMGDLV